MEKLVTVIMSVYNEEVMQLRQSVESIINQTYEKLEILIILDNPSNVRLFDVLEKYRKLDKRIRLIVNTENLGLAESLNIGIQNANGKYIARMDADDISVNQRIERQVSYMEKNSMCDILGTDRYDIDEAGKVKASNYLVPKDFRQIKRILKYSSPIVHPTVLMRKEIFDKLIGYRKFYAAQDYDLWLRALTMGYRINVMGERLLYYRIRNDGITMKNPYLQYVNRKYARKLYRQRVMFGIDKYSDEDMKSYFNHMNYTEPHIQNFKKANLLLDKGIMLIKEGKLFYGLKYVCNSFFINKKMIKVLHDYVMFKLAYK
jgi:glycosyltransferase involved in cell wall biosynthesis